MLTGFDSLKIIQRFHLFLFLFLITQINFEVLVFLRFETFLALLHLSYTFFLLLNSSAKRLKSVIFNIFVSILVVLQCLLSLGVGLLNLFLQVKNAILFLLFHSLFLNLQFFLHLLKFLHHVVLVLHYGLRLAHVNGFADEAIVGSLLPDVEGALTTAIPGMLLSSKPTLINKLDFAARRIGLGSTVYSKWRKQLFNLIWTKPLIRLELSLKRVEMSLGRLSTGGMRTLRAHQLREIESFVVVCKTSEIKAFSNAGTPTNFSITLGRMVLTFFAITSLACIKHLRLHQLLLLYKLFSDFTD